MRLNQSGRRKIGQTTMVAPDPDIELASIAVSFRFKMHSVRIRIRNNRHAVPSSDLATIAE